ncbi:MAG: cell division protein FtsX [Alphaproteobacteria bacterium]|nr:cell division protein FtsX [Alphaproteobacteria bacterium]
MNGLLRVIGGILVGDANADRVVPPSGFTAWLTTFTAGAMAFLAVFALALSLATGRLADRWSAELARTATVRISAPEGQMAAQEKAVLKVLTTTPGIKSARVMTDAEQRKLLEPWFGPDLPLDSLPIPKLIEVVERGSGPDIEGLRLRLAAEAPGAIYDDHTRWRRPLINAAARLRLLAAFSIGLIAFSTAAMITLAANAALAANATVISVLRLVGARDTYIARAFVRRFTVRAFGGALVGTILAVIGVFMLPSPAADGAFLSGLGFNGWGWGLPFVIPPLSAIVAFWATRRAAFRTLRGLS